MKCKYRFKIDSSSYIVNSFPLKIDKFTYFFENDKNEKKTTHLIVQIDNYQDDLPIVKTSKNNSKPNEFHFSSIDHNYIKNKLITLQGVFSLWGIYRIYFEDKDISWIPENGKEDESLPFTGITITRNKQNITEVPFSIFAQPILCLKDIEKYSMQLNFFRRGKIEYFNKQYRDSFIYFYLIIESFYGNGKSSEKELIKQYQRSQELNEIVEKILRKDKIQLSNKDYFSFIIVKRGFLLHHSSKSSKTWDPEKQLEIKNDTFTLSKICLEVILKKINKYICSNDTKNKYYKIVENLK